MIVDTSAVLAILFQEEDAPRFADALQAADRRRMSVVSYVEAGINLERQGAPGTDDVLDAFVSRAGIELEPVTLEQARLARAAFGAFGKGRHPAKLNFGDCFTYALSKATREPLLFKGNDFSLTDLEPALK